jgi:hypothetical protein
MRFDSIIGIFCGPLRYTRIYTRGPKPRYEHPKQAVRQGRWIAFSVCAVHVIPALITLVLVCLNASNVYVGSSIDAGVRMNIILDALQFAAKLHEVLIGASISAMALFFIQYAISGEGIFLGSLHVASRITELRTLFGPELWAVGFRGGLDRKLLATTSIAVFLIILAASSGPASAILMLPSLDWWSLDAQRIEKINNETYTVACLGENQSRLWPQHINGLSVSTPDSLGNDIAAGWSTILQGLNYNGQTFESQTSWNFTMSEQGLYNRFVGIAAKWPSLGSVTHDLLDDFVANRILGSSTSSLPGSLLEMLGGDLITYNEGLKFKLSLADGKDILAPLTATECVQASLAIINGIPDGYESLDEFQFRFLYTDGQYWYADARQHFEELWNSSDSNGRQSVKWVQSPNDGIGSPSIGAVALTIIQSDLVRIVTCSFFASWKASDLSFDYSTSRSVYSPSMGYSASSFWQSSTAVDAFKRTDTVHIDADWAVHALPLNDNIP